MATSKTSSLTNESRVVTYLRFTTKFKPTNLSRQVTELIINNGNGINLYELLHTERFTKTPNLRYNIHL